MPKALAAAYGVGQRLDARPLTACFTFSSSVNISGLILGGMVEVFEGGRD